jgi:hypothetical protein
MVILIASLGAARDFSFIMHISIKGSETVDDGSSKPYSVWRCLVMLTADYCAPGSNCDQH